VGETSFIAISLQIGVHCVPFINDD